MQLNERKAGISWIDFVCRDALLAFVGVNHDESTISVRQITNRILVIIETEPQFTLHRKA
jgi:hypothetical protein